MLLVLQLVRPAAACVCGSGLRETLPADGAVDVPVDVVPLLVFSLSDEGDPPPVLVDADTGALVPTDLEVTAVGADTTVRIRPRAPLEPDHAYELGGYGGYGDARFPVAFTTGAATDDVPPAAPALGAIDAQYLPDLGDCGSLLRIEPSIVPATDVNVVAHELAVAPDETFADATVATVVDVERYAALGHGVCTFNVQWLVPGQQVWLRARAVDVSGNAGPWTDGVAIVLPTAPDSGDTGDTTATPRASPPAPSPDRGCGCASTGANGAIVGALALGLTRRRARSTAR